MLRAGLLRQIVLFEYVKKAEPFDLELFDLISATSSVAFHFYFDLDSFSVKLLLQCIPVPSRTKK